MADAPVNQSFGEPPPPYSAAMEGAPQKAPYPVGGPNQPPPVGFVPNQPGLYPQGPTPYMNQPQTGAYPPTANTTTIVAAQPAQQTVTVIRMGNCPRCQTGIMVEDYTCCGIFLAIFFFPLGIICCLMLKDHHCNNCGYSP